MLKTTGKRIEISLSQHLQNPLGSAGAPKSLPWLSLPTASEPWDAPEGCAHTEARKGSPGAMPAGEFCIYFP